MRLVMYGALVALVLAASSPPAHAHDRSTLCSTTQPEDSPPLELAPAVVPHGFSHIAVALVSVDSTADALPFAHVTSPEVLAVAPLRDVQREAFATRLEPFDPVLMRVESRREHVRAAVLHRRRPKAIVLSSPRWRSPSSPHSLALSEVRNICSLARG